MCIFSTPKIQQVKQPEPAPTPTAEETAVINARDAERRRRAMIGNKATLLTSGSLNSQTTQRKTLLGV